MVRVSCPSSDNKIFCCTCIYEIVFSLDIKTGLKIHLNEILNVIDLFSVFLGANTTFVEDVKFPGSLTVQVSLL